MFSLRRKSLPSPHFGQGLFLVGIIVFGWLALNRPVFGLTGLGVVLIFAATLVELNRELIWKGYLKRYKKWGKGRWHEPLNAYYQINVYVLWPLIFLLGVGSLVAAYWAS